MRHRETRDHRRIGQKSHHNKTEADEKDRENSEEQEIFKTLTRIKSRIESVHRKQNYKRLERNSDRLWHVVEAAGLWAAAGVGAWAIISSGSDADKQRHIMSDQVGVMKLQMQPRPTFDTRLESGKAPDTPWFITPIWKNNGGRDALDFGGWEIYQYFTGDEPSIDTLLSTPNNIKIFRQTLGVQEAEAQSTVTIPYSVGEAYVKGIGNFLFWGSVSWKGPFDNDPVQTRHYCYILHFEQGKDRVQMTLPRAYKPECNKRN